jgi:hypothetical protein
LSIAKDQRDTPTPSSGVGVFFCARFFVTPGTEVALFVGRDDVGGLDARTVWSTR